MTSQRIIYYSEHSDKVEDLAELLFAKYPPKHLPGPASSRTMPPVGAQEHSVKIKAVQKLVKSHNRKLLFFWEISLMFVCLY